MCLLKPVGHFLSSRSNSIYPVCHSLQRRLLFFAVTVEGSDGLLLKGILIQARKSGETTALGSFASIGSRYQGLDCSSGEDTAVTHNSADDKTVPQAFTWTAPSDMNGEVEFV